MGIPVFLISDENYAMYMGVTIESICYNTDSPVDFYIIDGGIHNITKQKIYNFNKKYTNCTFEFLTVDKDLVSKFPNLNHFSLNTYFRYFIPDLKPQLDKVLYIDTDMVINTDIQKLYDIDLEGKPLGAVPYLFEYENEDYDKWGINLKNKLGIAPETKYFNAGMLIMDCKYFRENNITHTLIDKTKELSNILECPDQDILNILFANNYKEIEYKYNVIVDLIGDIKNQDLKSDLEKNQDYILHYTGGRNVRPWLTYGCECYDIFWKYANETVFADELHWRLLFKEIEKTNIRLNLCKIKREYLFAKIMSKLACGSLKKKYVMKKTEFKKLIKLVN